MATTDDWEIPLLDPNSVVNPVSTPFNALANAVDDAITAAIASLPLTQRGKVSFVGNGTSTVEVTVTFDEPYATAPTVIIGSFGLLAGNTLVGSVGSTSTTSFTGRMAQTGSAGPGFNGTYTVDWIATGERA